MAQMQAPRAGGGPPRNTNRPSFKAATAVFQHRNYRLLWLSSTFSFTSMQMQQVVRGLLAWELTESFTAVGAIALSFGLPMLMFALVGGSLADRFEKRNLTLMTQGATGLLTLATAIIVVTDLISIEALFAVGLIQGTFFALGMPARTPLMAEVVGPQNVMSAIAMSNASMNATRLVGPAIAGVVVAQWGFGTAYFIQTFFYVLSVATLLFVPTGIGAAARALQAAKAPPKGNMMVEIGRGLKYVATESRLRLLVGMMFILTLFAMPYQVLLPGFVQDDLGKGESAVGVLHAIAGGGALLASLAVATLTQFDRKPLLQWICGIIGGGGMILLAVASAGFGYAGAIGAIFLLGIVLTAYQTLNNTMVMDAARPEYYGRVMSINMLTFSVMPVIALPLGAMADNLGANRTFILMGGIVLAFMLVVAVFNASYTFGRAKSSTAVPMVAEEEPSPAVEPEAGEPGYAGASSSR